MVVSEGMELIIVLLVILANLAGLVWQGYEPYRWSDIAREAVGLAGGGLPARVRGIVMAPLKAAFNSERRTSTE